MNKKLEGLLDDYGTEILGRAEDIDPGNEEDWNSMTIGWAIAKGLTIDDAKAFAQEYGG